MQRRRAKHGWALKSKARASTNGAKLGASSPRKSVLVVPSPCGQGLLARLSAAAPPPLDHTLRRTTTGAGLTPLHVSAGGGFEDIVELLLDKGACATARDAAGQTPLHLAAQVSLRLPALAQPTCIEPHHCTCHWLQCALPMCSYQLASRAPAACLEQDLCQQTPVDLAIASAKGEVRW